jgi:hypothetical protein
MHLMRESWTDARLDDFRGEVDRRFNEVDRRFDEVDKRFDKVEGDIRELRGEVKEIRSEMKTGFESINRTMVHGVVALSAAFIAGFAAIVTQL